MSMSVSEAVETRMSCRAFLPKQVPHAMVRELLEKARRAPSGGNLQPWRVYVLGGAALGDFLTVVRGKREQLPEGEGTEYPIYPPKLDDPYRARRYQCGEDLYKTIDIARDNRAGRLSQWGRNFDLFGAPLAMFFAIGRSMGAAQWSDLGMFIQTLMLLARESGLHTCAQESWAMWHRTVSEFFHFPEDLMLFCGLCLGYRDETAPINTLRTQRAALDEFATFRGFD